MERNVLPDLQLSRGDERLQDPLKYTSPRQGYLNYLDLAQRNHRRVVQAHRRPVVDEVASVWQQYRANVRQQGSQPERRYAG